MGVASGQTAVASQPMGLPMNLKLFTAVAIFATAHMVAFAQMMTRPVVQTISSDKTKL